MNLSTLLAAMIAVESGGDDTAVGNHGEHGALQIRQVFIDDVNERCGTHYRLSDMHVRSNAVRCATLYLGIWATREKLGHEPTDFDRCAIFHAGPKGYLKPHTRAYWREVQFHLKK